jgi:hypothetical protein
MPYFVLGCSDLKKSVKVIEAMSDDKNIDKFWAF